MENIEYYRQNAKIIADVLRKKNIPFTGGVNSPYIWFECPNGMESWEFFDYLLTHAQVVGTPGAGFGENGKNYFRLTAFGQHESTAEAMRRFEECFKQDGYQKKQTGTMKETSDEGCLFSCQKEDALTRS